jgi:hypothetical protein
MHVRIVRVLPDQVTQILRRIAVHPRMRFEVHHAPFFHGARQHASGEGLHRIAVDKDDANLVPGRLGRFDLRND